MYVTFIMFVMSTKNKNNMEKTFLIYNPDTKRYFARHLVNGVVWYEGRGMAYTYNESEAEQSLQLAKQETGIESLVLVPLPTKIDFNSEQVLTLKGKTVCQKGNGRIGVITGFDVLEYVIDEQQPAGRIVGVAVVFSDIQETVVFSSVDIEKNFELI